MEKKNKILLITTKGCAGCTIVKKLIEQAIEGSGIDVSFEQKDFTDLDKKTIKKYRIKDFPTVFLIQNDVVKFSFTGTRPVVVIVQWIRVHLK